MYANFCRRCETRFVKVLTSEKDVAASYRNLGFDLLIMSFWFFILLIFCCYKIQIRSSSKFRSFWLLFLKFPSLRAYIYNISHNIYIYHGKYSCTDISWKMGICVLVNAQLHIDNPSNNILDFNRLKFQWCALCLVQLKILEISLNVIWSLLPKS